MVFFTWNLGRSSSNTSKNYRIILTISWIDKITNEQELGRLKKQRDLTTNYRSSHEIAYFYYLKKNSWVRNVLIVEDIVTEEPSRMVWVCNQGESDDCHDDC